MKSRRVNIPAADYLLGCIVRTTETQIIPIYIVKKSPAIEGSNLIGIIPPGAAAHYVILVW